MDKIENLNELIKKLESSNGLYILNEMKSLKSSIYVFNTNYNELNLRLTDLKQFNDKKNNINLENKRLIHNFLCSAITLIDHTRIYISNLHKEIIFNEYQLEVEKIFIQNSLCCFVKDFRQYLQHYKLPEISFQSNDILSIKKYWSIIIKKEELLKFSGWKKNSVIFIENSFHSIDLHKVFNEYNNIVIAFYEWIFKNQNEIFKNQISEVQFLENQIKEIKMNNLVNYVLLDKFKNFKSFENEFYSIFGNSINNESKINDLIKIEKMINMFNLRNTTKLNLKNRLENLLF